MAIKDIESELRVSVALAAAISTDTTTTGAILDTEGFEMGLMFALDVSAYTDGTYVLTVFESNDSGMSGATAIVAPNVLPTTNTAGTLTASAVVAEGADLAKLGVFGNKRYVQCRVVSTSTTSGATLRITATQKTENSPV